MTILNILIVLGLLSLFDISQYVWNFSHPYHFEYYLFLIIASETRMDIIILSELSGRREAIAAH